MENREKTNIHLRTDEVNELLSTEPMWLYRWGITIIFMMMLVVLIFSRFIKYPEVMVTKATMIVIKPFPALASKTGGEISIVSSEREVMLAKLILLIQNSGKLKIGQTVKIRPGNGPLQACGVLNGFVKQIALTPKNNTYDIEFVVPSKSQALYKKGLGYNSEINCTAEIVIEELSVFDRIFYQFKKLLK